MTVEIGEGDASGLASFSKNWRWSFWEHSRSKPSCFWHLFFLHKLNFYSYLSRRKFLGSRWWDWWDFYLGIRYLFVQLWEKMEARQRIASELDMSRVKMFHEIFINVARRGQKKADLLMSAPLAPFCPEWLNHLLHGILFLLGILKAVRIKLPPLKHFVLVAFERKPRPKGLSSPGVRYRDPWTKPDRWIRRCSPSPSFFFWS